MISFSLLKSGLDEESTLLNIKSKMQGHCVTLQNIKEAPSNLQDCYMVCKFISKVVFKINENLGNVLELICREGEFDYNVIFVKEMAERMHKLILSEKISVGSFLSMKNPAVVVLFEKTHVKSVIIEIGQKENQIVTIWKSESLFYIEPFLMQSTHLAGYRHLLFYELDYIGSKEHVLMNMYDLVLPYGPVKSLSEIAGRNSKSVALATFTRRIASSINGKGCDAYVQIKFNEILLESKHYVSTAFNAFFFDELAKEIDNAVNNKHVEPGDLVALICPYMKCKTAAPINIVFPATEQINLIILKNQYPIREIGTKLCISDINFSYSNDCNKIEEPSDFYEPKDYSPVEFLSIKNFTNVENVLLKIKHKLKKYGQVTTLKSVSEDDLHSFKKGIIVAYFLKLIASSNFSEKNGKVTFYLREITVDCVYGACFKLGLRPRFYKPFYSAVKNKSIVRGDIICFVNPFVWKNPAFIQNIYEIDLSYLLEIAIPVKQRLAVFKLREIGKGINQESKQFKLVKQDLGTEGMNDLLSIDLPNTHKSSHNEDFSCIDQVLNTVPNKIPTKDPATQLGGHKIPTKDPANQLGGHKIRTKDPANQLGGHKIPTKDPSTQLGGHKIPTKDPATQLGGHKIPTKDPATQLGGHKISTKDPATQLGSHKISNKDPATQLGSHKIPTKDPANQLGGHKIPTKDPATQLGGHKIPTKDPATQLGGHKIITKNYVKSLNTHEPKNTLILNNNVDKSTSSSLKKSFLKDLFAVEDREKIYSVQNKFKRIKIDDENVSLEEGIIKTRDDLERKDESTLHHRCTSPRTEEQQNSFQSLNKTKNQFDQSYEIKRVHKEDKQHHTPSEPDESSRQTHRTTGHEEVVRNCWHRQHNQSFKPNETESQGFVYSKYLNSDKHMLISQKQGPSPQTVINPNLIPESCFSKSIHNNHQLSFTKYEQKFSLLPMFLSKPVIEQSLDIVSGFCEYSCKKMYPYSFIKHAYGDLSKPRCPRCRKMLKLDFCLEMIASGMNRRITLLLQGTEAEIYLKVTCRQFLNYNKKNKEQIVTQLKEELEQNQKSGKGRTIETTDTTYWWYT